MVLFTWWRSFLPGRKLARRSRIQSGQRLQIRRPFQPRVEALEDRMVPTAINWTSPVSGDWGTASNWSTGTLPGSGDDVTISTPGITVTHQNGGTAKIHSLTVNGSTAVNLVFSNGA